MILELVSQFLLASFAIMEVVLLYYVIRFDIETVRMIIWKTTM